jgi:hypothetical protein
VADKRSTVEYIDPLAELADAVEAENTKADQTRLMISALKQAMQKSKAESTAAEPDGNTKDLTQARSERTQKGKGKDKGESKKGKRKDKGESEKGQERSDKSG